MGIREDFARNLRRLRHEKGFSQEALANEAEIDRTYISALERGIYSASLTMLEKLADVLRVEPADLIVRTPSPIRKVRRPRR
jgi:transcriptional regulator with XRE-family HTH domain